MKQLLVLSLSGAVALACMADDGLVARPDGFDVDALARKEVMGRGYWTQSINYPTEDRTFPGNRDTGIGDLPVFRDHAIGSGFGNRRPIKGSGLATWRTVAENVPGGTNAASWKAFEKTGNLPVPAFAGFWAKRAYQSMCGKVDLDYDDFAAWVKRHPNLVCIEMLDEWAGDRNNIESRLHTFANDAEREEVKRRYYSFGNTREGLLKSAKAFVDRKLEVNYSATNLFGALSSFMMSADFMAAAWGAKCIAEEVTDTNMRDDWEMRWELPAFSARGAARQFGILWKWYVAIFKTGYTKDGKWQVETTCVQDPGRRDPDGKGLFGPKGGISPSLQRRAFFYGYLAGANFLQTEMARMQLFVPTPDRKAEVLSDRGEAWVECDLFARNHPDRGEPYTPVAILMPFDQGYGSHGGQGWFHHVRTYTEADHMLDGVFYSIVPGRKRAEGLKRGVEYCLHNVELPMMFDALSPDAPQDKNRFLSVLKAYPVAVLAGSYTGVGVSGFWPVLEKYVQGGGTLLIPKANVPADVTERIRAMTGREITDGAKKKMGVSYTVGEGRLIVSASDWMVPDVGSDIWQTQLEMWSGARQFPEIAFFLKRFRDELFPFEVKGSCLYGANKTKSGWWLWTMNNDGVTKYTDTEQRIDKACAKAVEVTVGKDVKCVRELLSGCEVLVRDGRFKWTIPAGDLAIFHVERDSRLERPTDGTVRSVNGNKAVNPKVGNRLPSDKPRGTLLLSFDDRNFRDWIRAIPLFARYNARATFFVSGPIDAEAIGVMKRLSEAGHTIGLHGLKHRNADQAVARMGAERYFNEEILPQLAACRTANIPVTSFAYPNCRRSDETDALFGEKGFRHVRGGHRGVAPYDPKGVKQEGLRPISVVDRAFFPSGELKTRFRYDTVLSGEAYHTDIEEILRCIRRCAERDEVFVLASHGIHTGAGHIHMKTEWLERILATASECGVEVLGFDEL